MLYSGRIIWGLVFVLLLSNLPLFLSMPLTADAVFYDLQAQCLLEGGVLYRDFLEPNLPGIVWCHALIRSVGGWSTTTLRIVDLLVVFSIILLMSLWVNINTKRRELRNIFTAVTCLVMSSFYLGTSEWCHCQRDTWMLAPMLLGLTIFYHSIKKLRKASFCDLRLQYLPLLSCGLLFGLAFWLKPFVAFPALGMLLATKLYVPRWVNYAQIVMTIISGGLLAGILGICWMISSGCWLHFLETLTQWNPEYYQAGRSRWTWERFTAHSSRFWPWILIYLPAVFLSLKQLLEDINNAFFHGKIPLEKDCSSALLQSFTLGWLLQAFAFQQLFDYIHVPGIMLSSLICLKFLSHHQSSNRENSLKPKMISLLAGLFILGVISNSAMLNFQRLRHWPTCIKHGLEVPSAVKDDLCYWPLPRWQELEHVMEFIQSQNISDREVLAYNGSLIQIYPLLGFHSPTRFAYLDVHARCFPKHRAEISQKIDEAKPKLIICNLEEDGFPSELLDQDQALEELEALLFEHNHSFPYNQKLIFKSRNYLVFRKVKLTGELTATYRPFAGLKVSP